MSHIFISYVQEDESTALEIARGLEAAGYRTWYYKRDCVPGPSYLVQTGQAIEESQAVVLLISSNSLGSHQVTKEVVRAHEAVKPFVPVLKGIQFPEFQQRQPEWREALGSATSIEIPPGGVAEILPRIIGGLRNLGQQPPTGGADSHPGEQPHGVVAAAAKQARSYLRVIVGVGAILLLSPFVGGTVLLLGQTLSRSNPRSLAYVCTAIFDLLAFYFFFRFEKKRSAAEDARKRIENWAQTSRSAAFRSLDPYSEADTLPGTERKRQARRLVTSIKDPSFRFGVVSGDVGCGKTSLLQSEVQRLLKADHFIPVLVARSDILDTKDVTELCDAIKAAATRDRGPRVLILDQVEEILIRFPGREARQKIGALSGQLVRGDRACKIVCAIRKDYFLDLYGLGAAMDIDVRPTLMLHNFTPDEAKEVIQECAAEEGLSLADELVDMIVADLTKEAQVRPPELQIVCTALTANFTRRHYNELGGAKGILESYLTLILETSIDEQTARLILRQMCDFERQAKADPKSANELAQAIAPQQDDSGATERAVQQVLDHLVRSRLAVMVGGKYGLIHDYWVSIIRDTTIHDRSERERADELLRRHIHELEAGFSSTLSSKQLRLVRRFANRDLLSTKEAANLLRRSGLRLWISRGLAAGMIFAVIAGGLLSSTVAWKVESLADLGDRGHPIWSIHFLKDTGRIVLTPFRMGRQDRSSISVSVWEIGTGRRVSDFKTDEWDLSPRSDVLLYADHGQAYLADIEGSRKNAFPRVFKSGDHVRLSDRAHCALFISSANSETDTTIRAPMPHQVQLWSLPEGKLLAHTSLTAKRLDPAFVSEACDRAVLLVSSDEEYVPGSSYIKSKKPLLWDVHEAQPKPIASGPTIVRTDVAVDEKLRLLAALETDARGGKSIGLWDLDSGNERLKRGLEPSGHIWDDMTFGPDGRYIAVSHISSENILTGTLEVKVMRLTDLQEPQFVDGQHLISCTGEDSRDLINDVLWSTVGHTGYVWDASDHDPAPLHGLDSSDLVECTVSADHSRIALLRKGGSAELWSLKGNKVADLRAAGPATHLGWSLQGTSVALVTDSGQIRLFDRSGALLATLPPPGSRFGLSRRQTRGFL